ncbi:hypothetical protein EDC94DRAFT_656032 [Helicostylum pulchrum]|nr:hypothetical protein EDC94DRAFT_656032 [Helicostylum pulchrum]
MSVYRQDKEESPWAILDPSLKQHCSLNDPSSFKPTYLEYPVSIIHSPSIEEEEKEPENQQELLLENCTSKINEIETELIHHRNSIYSEKLKVLQDELLSIENETYKEIIKQDKKLVRKRDKELATMEAMYQYQLEMVEKQVEHERLQILEDINQKTDFARRVIISEGSLNVSSTTKKRKEISPSYSETDETESDVEQNIGFKKIHLKKKISKLQAISDRQRASKKNLEDALSIDNQEDLDLDMMMIKKSICGD